MHAPNPTALAPSSTPRLHSQRASRRRPRTRSGVKLHRRPWHSRLLHAPVPTRRPGHQPTAPLSRMSMTGQTQTWSPAFPPLSSTFQPIFPALLRPHHHRRPWVQPAPDHQRDARSAGPASPPNGPIGTPSLPRIRSRPSSPSLKPPMHTQNHHQARRIRPTMPSLTPSRSRPIRRAHPRRPSLTCAKWRRSSTGRSSSSRSKHNRQTSARRTTTSSRASSAPHRRPWAAPTRSCSSPSSSRACTMRAPAPCPPPHPHHDATRTLARQRSRSPSQGVASPRRRRRRRPCRPPRHRAGRAACARPGPRCGVSRARSPATCPARATLSSPQTRSRAKLRMQARLTRIPAAACCSPRTHRNSRTLSWDGATAAAAALVGCRTPRTTARARRLRRTPARRPSRRAPPLRHQSTVGLHRCALATCLRRRARAR